MNAQTVRRKPSRKKSPPIQEELESMCSTLVKQRDQALLAIEQLRAENKMLRYNLHMLMDKDYGKPLDKEKLLAQAVPFAIDDIIAELKQKVR